MTIRVCDNCNNEIKDKYYLVRLNWTLCTRQVVNEEKNTPSLELCENCFNKTLENLGLDKE